MVLSLDTVVVVVSAEATVLSLQNNTPYARTFILKNMDSMNTMTLKFQESMDGGNTWEDIVDPDIFQIAPGEQSNKQVVNSNLVRLRASGAGLLAINVSRYADESGLVMI